MHAILLAAGRGRRLESDKPKCLLEIEGKTLLDRHLAAMKEAGVTELSLVVGYEQDQIRAHVAKSAPALPVTFVENARFVRGSIVSLGCAIERIYETGGLFMDADVLYPASLLARLVSSKHENCVLVDDQSEETGEEMMVGIKEGRVLAIARRVTPLGTWDAIGESVGFAKVGPACARLLGSLIAREIEADRLDQEYEAAMNVAFKELPWGYEPVGDAPWTEIDFAEDVEKAKKIAKILAG